ncbi:MAG: M28 family metallopeptidase [Candidatus Nanopelagicales bacterium]|jgi:aminopeptidase YwaD|nr:M28 family metallopeptidase [Candidatus Nanopelagicales bacterium]
MLDLPDLLDSLCAVRPDRRPGSPGNAAATELVARTLRALGWAVETPEFPVVDWAGEPGRLTIDGRSWTVHPSPYGTGWTGIAPVHAAASEADLAGEHDGAILLLHGELTAGGPLTPKGYPFYGSDRDTRIIGALEASGAAAVLAITGTAPGIAGSVDPFALVEDSAFTVPAGDLRRDDGAALLATLAAQPSAGARLELPARRWPSTARNVLARRGDQSDRVVVVAHVDTKPGTPGAIDNGTGVVVLLRVAELLADLPADARPGVELLAVNGEDSHQAAGELDYLASADLGQVRLAINVDGAGHRSGPTASSTYGTADTLDLAPLRAHGVVPGEPWPQSDHMVFAMAGVPAIALTSSAMQRLLVDVVHSPHDTPELADPALLEGAAQGIAALVRAQG